MRAWVAALLLLAPVGALADADRALRDARGTVVAVTESPDAEGVRWVDAEVVVDGDGRVRLRLGPAEALAAEGFRVATGDVVRVRYFTGEFPFDVQRIRNEASGSVFRARCLHGDPVWFGGHGRGGADRRGAGGRGGRR